MTKGSRYALIAVGGVAGAFIGMAASRGDLGVSPWLTMLVIFAVVGAMIWFGLRGNQRVPLADAGARARALIDVADGSARLIVLREGFVAKLSGIDVLLDGAVRTQLKSPRFAALAVAPGRHIVEAKVAMKSKPVGPVELDLSPGEIAVVRIVAEIGEVRLEREPWAPAIRAKLSDIPMVAAA